MLSKNALVGFAVAVLLTAPQAHAGELTPGSWRLSVGNTPPCLLSVTADGTASLSSDCNRLGAVARWKATDAGVDLVDAGGATLVSLKQGNDAYTGLSAAERRRILLTR